MGNDLVDELLSRAIPSFESVYVGFLMMVK